MSGRAEMPNRKIVTDNMIIGQSLLQTYDIPLSQPDEERNSPIIPEIVAGKKR